MYEVICKFADIEDGLHVYEIGDTYPRKGVKVTGRRIAELATSKNKIGRILIKEVPESKPDPDPVKEEKTAKEQ